MLEVLLAILLIVVAFLIWITPNNEYFKKRNIKYMDPRSMFRIAVGSITKKYTATEFVQIFYQAFPDESFIGSFDFGRPKYTVRDPEAIKQIAIKDFDHFEDHPPLTNQKADKLWGNSLHFMNGQKWRQMRATLNPAFTGNKMRQMFELVVECADDVVNHFQERTEKEERINAEMNDYFYRYTSDHIASCAFGLKINSIADPQNDFHVNARRMVDFTGLKYWLRMFLLNSLPAVATALDISTLKKSTANFFKQIILDTLDFRKKNNISRPDIINTLMQIREGTLEHQSAEEKEDDEEMELVVDQLPVNSVRNGDEIVAQCFTFFAAGLNAPANALTFALYELTAQPDIQEKLYDEIIETESSLGGKRITYDALQKMKFMDQVICETLRKWPSAVQTDRICVKDYIYDDGDKLKFKVEKGSIIVFPTYCIQNDSKYFPQPEKFDPDRFSDENKANITPGTYIPFGIGPRYCIGAKFALMVMKAVLYYLLLKFSFEANKNSQIPIELKKGAANPRTEMHLELKPRKRT